MSETNTKETSKKQYKTITLIIKNSDKKKKQYCENRELNGGGKNVKLM